MPSRRRESGVRLRGVRGRTVGNRQPVPVILIVCEGKKTEPNYFNDFPVPKQIREIHGLGMDPLRLVQEARAFQQQYRRERGYDYGQVWCVFDRDEVPLERFRQALKLAEENGFHLAYSNPAFELWYLLHFRYSDRPMTRYECQSELEAWLNSPYQKHRKLYSTIQVNQPDAIKHAMRLLAQYNPCDPANDNPSTTVHLLVQELNRHLRS
jgi:hypothetical protein